MQKLQSLLDKHVRWKPLSEYVNRIEGYQNTDFSLCIENAKALLESVAKEICGQKGQQLEGTESVSKVLNYSFGALGYHPTNTMRQIGTAIANVGQQMGNFRNEVGTTSHGKTLGEITNRQSSIESLTGNFLLDSTEIVCCFLIASFETEKPAATKQEEIKIDDNDEFNTSLDEQDGEFAMGDYSFWASEILFNNDPEAYNKELNLFMSQPNEADNGE